MKVFRGENPYFYTEIYDQAGALVDPATSITCTVKDPAGAVKVNDLAMTKISTGKYYYYAYQITATDIVGTGWYWYPKATDGTVITYPKEPEYFEVQDI